MTLHKLPELLTIERARERVARMFERRCLQWLRHSGDTWPLRLRLGELVEAVAMQELPAVREWIIGWRNATYTSGCTVEWVDRHWNQLGAQRLPSYLIFESAVAVACFLQRDDQWQCLKYRFAELVALGVSDAKAARVARNLSASYTHQDFDILINLLRWARHGRDSGLYLRQIPVSGLDTKWIEQRKAAVESLLRDMFPGEGQPQDLHALLGLLRAPLRIRVRVLGDTLRRSTGGLSDIEAPIAEIAALDLRPICVLIIENVEPGLSISEYPGTVVIMGLGYAVDLLVQLPWLLRADKILYWGDIDTHGFACLARARQGIPALQSLLMDEATLLANQPLWVEETEPATIETPVSLSMSEQAMFDDLRANRFQKQVRLEQERIPPAQVCAALDAAILS
jgi:hypothetical protein